MTIRDFFCITTLLFCVCCPILILFNLDYECTILTIQASVLFVNFIVYKIDTTNTKFNNFMDRKLFKK